MREITSTTAKTEGTFAIEGDAPDNTGSATALVVQTESTRGVNHQN
jgi:hypothetical protein